MAQDPAPPADDGALEALLRDRRFGPPEPNDATPWDFVRRWPDAVVRGRAWPIISRLLTDGDELVRARAVELVCVWSEGADLTRARVFEVAERPSRRALSAARSRHRSLRRRAPRRPRVRRSR